MTNNKKILGLLGLSARARKVCFGADSTEQEIEKNKVYLVIVAEDASERTKTKFAETCQKHGIPLIIFESIDEISKAIGKQNKAIIGIKEKNLANEIDKIFRGDVKNG